nr:MoxR family ATPase [Bifidobacterium dolichotidis]
MSDSTVPNDSAILNDSTVLSTREALNDDTVLSPPTAPHSESKTAYTPSNPATKNTHIAATNAPFTNTDPLSSDTGQLSPAQFHQIYESLISAIGRTIIGKTSVIRLCFIALIAGGHVLIEDTPGTGKTTLARTLAALLHLPTCRVQCTPDLLPSDITGITIFDQHTGSFRFRKGPVFTNLLLVDEINRASPKTQSALLEVMEEHQVTADGTTYAVPKPFLVVATQNPIEQSGTYALPEAQMDRFMLRTSMGYPSHDAAITILSNTHAAKHTQSEEIPLPLDSAATILAMQATAQHTHAASSLLDYIVRLVESARHQPEVESGPSMRAALALLSCAKVLARIHQRDYVLPQDVKQLAINVLAHRLVLSMQAQFNQVKQEDVVQRVLNAIPMPQTDAVTP